MSEAKKGDRMDKTNGANEKQKNEKKYMNVENPLMQSIIVYTSHRSGF